MDILEYWHLHQEKYPILSQMARDILAITTNGVGVESLFNTAQDVCHYQHGHLHPETIQAIMLQLTTDRFTIREEYRQLLDTHEVTVQEPDKLLDEPPDDVNYYISDQEDLGGFEEADDNLYDDDFNNHHIKAIRADTLATVSPSPALPAAPPTQSVSCCL